MEGIHVEQRTVGRLSVWLIAGAAGIAVGCADNTGDPKFAAQTFDEYTEPLTNAVVGTPSGTTTIGPNGETTFVPAEVAAVAAAPAPGASPALMAASPAASARAGARAWAAASGPAEASGPAGWSAWTAAAPTAAG